MRWSSALAPSSFGEREHNVSFIRSDARWQKGHGTLWEAKNIPVMPLFLKQQRNKTHVASISLTLFIPQL